MVFWMNSVFLFFKRINCKFDFKNRKKIIIIIIIIIISSRTKIVLVGQWLWCRQIARKSDDE